jgi:hypothetical protein
MQAMADTLGVTHVRIKSLDFVKKRVNNMKILSAVFTNNGDKLTVICAHKGKLESATYPMSRKVIELSDEVSLHTEKGGVLSTLTTSKVEILRAAHQTDLAFAEWKTLRDAGALKKDWVDWHFDRLELLARSELMGLPATASSQFRELEKNQASNSDDIIRCALALHEHLGSWIQILLKVLSDKGIDREHGSLGVASLREKMEAISCRFPPPVVSLTLLFLLDFHATTLGQNDFQVQGLREAGGGLGKGLVAILKEEGWTKEDINPQTSLLTDKLVTAAKESGSLVFALTVAVILDNYAKHLVKETLLPKTS